MMMVQSTKNSAITMEETIYEAKAGINKEEKRRIDLFINMVDSVESYNDHESETFTKVVEARNQAKGGTLGNAGSLINSLTEAYPELKSNENYQILMKEFSITENRIADYKGNYNKMVKAYKSFVRKFPNASFLGWTGYELIDFEYYNDEVDNTKATNLFRK